MFSINWLNASSSINSTVWMLGCLEIFSTRLISLSPSISVSGKSLRTLAKWRHIFCQRITHMVSIPSASGVCFQLKPRKPGYLWSFLSALWFFELQSESPIKVGSQHSKSNLVGISKSFSRISCVVSKAHGQVAVIEISPLIYYQNTSWSFFFHPWDTTPNSCTHCSSWSTGSRRKTTWWEVWWRKSAQVMAGRKQSTKRGAEGQIHPFRSWPPWPATSGQDSPPDSTISYFPEALQISTWALSWSFLM